MSSRREKTESEKNGWTDSEVEALVDELKIIKDAAIDEAVKAAVIPLYGKIDELEKKNKNQTMNVILVGVFSFLGGFFVYSIIDSFNGGG